MLVSVYYLIFISLIFISNVYFQVVFLFNSYTTFYLQVDLSFVIVVFYVNL